MIPILPYYCVSGSRLDPIESQSSWILPTLCERCGAYRKKDCVTGKTGFMRCRRGLSIFVEENFGVVFFGLRVKGCFNGSICEPFGFFGVCLNEDGVKYIVGLQCWCLAGIKWVENMENDQGAYADAVERIRGVSRGVDWELQGETVCLDRSAVLSALEAVRDINKARAHAKEIRRNLELYVQIQTVPVLLERYRNILVPYFDCASKMLASIRKWIHDEAQYKTGLVSLITKLNECDVQAYKVEDIHRIDAFCYALMMLRRSAFSATSKTTEIGIHKIFQRYRYCFSTPDVKWKFWREHGMEFRQRLYVKQGFESVPLNVLDNVVKYLPKDHKHRFVVISFSESPDEIVVTIKSYGPPRTEMELMQIWKEGNRGDESKLEVYKVPGHGLGLNQVKKIVEEHGFNISATSNGKMIFSRGLPYRIFAVRLGIPRRYIRSNHNAY